MSKRTSQANECDADDVKRSNLEIHEFPKYVKLVPNLRAHVLSYSNLSTLRNYSQCSRYCNSEIKKFNTVRPHRLHLVEDEEGILVKLVYGESEDKHADKKFLFCDDGNIMENIVSYLLNCRKYESDGLSYGFTVDMKSWPKEVVNNEKIMQRIIGWDITVRRSMYADFVDFAKTTRRDGEVNLMDCEEVNERVVLDAEFFKCRFARSYYTFRTDMDFNLDENSFLNGLEFHLEVKRLIDFDLIRRKIREHTGMCQSSVSMDLRHLDDFEFDMEVLCPSDQFEVEYDEENRTYHIGQYVEAIICYDGKELGLTFYERNYAFRGIYLG